MSNLVHAKQFQRQRGYDELRFNSTKYWNGYYSSKLLAKLLGTVHQDISFYYGDPISCPCKVHQRMLHTLHSVERWNVDVTKVFWWETSRSKRQCNFNHISSIKVSRIYYPNLVHLEGWASSKIRPQLCQRKSVWLIDNWVGLSHRTKFLRSFSPQCRSNSQMGQDECIIE